MIKIVTIVGARPQFIKAAAISRAISTHYADQVKEVIVHTGQHYDQNMSQVFFDEMKIPQPDYNLQVGSAGHGPQTAKMIVGIEEILIKEQPDCMIVYGDTNSTLAGAIAASKLYLPVAHIESGLRSFNKRMPEEINRILCDHVSTFLFCPSQAGYDNLVKEGFKTDNPAPYNMDNPRIWNCGDVMYDNTLYFKEFASTRTDIVSRLKLEDSPFILGTCHRNNNTDQPERLHAIVEALVELADNSGRRLVLPLHPRTTKMIGTSLDPDLRAKFQGHDKIEIIPPVSFLEMTLLEAYCDLVITDSGGVQKEAFYLQKPCIVLRGETEWVELVDNGTCMLADADKGRILGAYEALIDKTDLSFPEIYGNGHTSEFIIGQLVQFLPAV